MPISTHDPIALVALHLAIILVAAKLGGHLAVRARQPAVLGELVAGVLLGNAAFIGLGALESIKTDAAIDMLSRIGVLLLLFEVGLASTVKEMLEVGWTAFLVAVLGVVTPMLLGFGVGAWLLPGASVYQHLFLGAMLSATSVGITARVFQDLNRTRSLEARIILGAAVIDDVLGLVLLAVVAGIIASADAGTPMSAGSILGIVGIAVAFLVVSLVVGVRIAPQLVRAARWLRAPSALLATGLAFCFMLAWLAGIVGLAPIVGAFAAGLIFEPAHYTAFTERGEQGLDELVRPIAGFLVPVFFVLMGMRTDLRVFAQPGVLALAGALTVAAVLGKQACALGAWKGGVNRLAVGIGMIPRGEVGLIFASIGLTLLLGGVPVIGPSIYSAVVVMVIVTTLMTPPLLKWSLERGKR